ncbi:MAG: VOC family protein [Acidimicrobiales bacterium]
MAQPVVHFEIIGPDATGLQAFYGKVFDWKIDANNPMEYGVVEAGEGGIAGGISKGDGDSTAATFYVQVDDPQAALDQIETLGGKTVMPVVTIPGMVTFAQFSDPAGNVIGLVATEIPPAD